MKTQLIIASIFLLVSCNTKTDMESPLVTVIKLNSAESLADFEEARKYIDVEKVYTKNIQGNKSPEQAWKEYVQFSYDLGQDKKFTNAFKYYNYRITESQHQNKAEVTLDALSSSKAKIQRIVYHLELYEDRWKVVDVEYLKE